MRYKLPKSVLVIIYDERRHVLVMQRLDDSNFWQSVTGSMEPDETPAETAQREVREETGIDIDAHGYPLLDCGEQHQYEIRPQWRHRYEPGVTLNTEYLFYLQVRSGQPVQLTEHSDYVWLPATEAAQKVWSATNKNAILDLLKTGFAEQRSD
ncbi:dihydroneopterin triphosphate diphosphatase [Bowmanella dokdonensis]|uniref:Dihydroneopterin triphosphate diphosphatase n=1 Tax=Bowmanella dokdonensis TaxID=751969 RepID=A0A939ITF1_9ALTE|nr:dihydroneopterin triphosphate diphosphatase [Bowmanella dokdonensis]MBN7827717.1 dihydroneopterin triphosphate diphosphatase [Bowmanella dokdonensis]